MSEDNGFVARPEVRYRKRDRHAVLAQLLETAQNGKAVRYDVATHGTPQQFRQSIQVMLLRRHHKLHCVKQGEETYIAWAECIAADEEQAR